MRAVFTTKGNVVGAASVFAAKRYPANQADTSRSRADGDASGLLAGLAEIFVEDMLRLEREHGLNADQMMDHYRGICDLESTGEERDEASRHIHKG